MNSRGGRARGSSGRILLVGVLVIGTVIGGIAVFRSYRAGQAAEDSARKAAQARQNQTAPVARRRTFEVEDPPAPTVKPIERPAPPPMATPPCVDSEILLGPDGKPVMSVSGAPMRVCRDGRVFVRNGAPAVPAVVQTKSAPAGPPAPSRFAGDLLLPVRDEISRATAQVMGHSAPAGDRASERLRLDGRADYGTRDGLTRVSWPGEAGSATTTTREANVQLAQAGASPAGAPSPSSSGNARRPTDVEAAQRGPLDVNLRPGETPRVGATMLGDRNMILPRGRTIDCSLATRVVTEVSGMAECTIASNVYSDNGRVLLVERGSQASGEYRANMAMGQRRLFLLWNRIKTPNGVVIDLNSPASDALGASGLPGHIDNRWGERVGAALLISLVQDAVSYGIQRERSGRDRGNVYYESQPVWASDSTGRTSERIVEEVLSQTLAIRPTLFKNHGDRAAIYVARDLDFSAVYELQPR